YIVMTNPGATGISAKDGAVVWHYAKKPPYSDVLIPTPILHDGHVYMTNGHGSGGCALVNLTCQGGRIQGGRGYCRANMQNQQGGVVLLGGQLYGYSEGKGWICQDFKTGKIVWNEKNDLGRGSVSYADGHLYCYDQEEGQVALVPATDKGWELKGRITI